MSNKQSTSEETQRLSTPESALLEESQIHYNRMSSNRELHDGSEHKYNLKVILPAIWMGSFLAAMDGTVVANIMNGIASDFQQEDLKSWIATSYLLTNTAFQPLYGKVSDIVGRKYALMFAQFFFGFGCFLSIFSNNIVHFSIARAVCGIGGGGLGAMSSIIVSDIVTLEERGLYQGYANLNYALGQTLGAPLGAILLTTIGWRWIFGIQVPSVMICMWLAYKHVNLGHEKPLTRENFSRIDFGGSITLVSSITAFLLLLSTNLNKVVLSLVFLLSSCLFFYIETFIAKEQIVPAHLVKGLLGVCGLSSFAVTFILYAALFGIPSFLQIVQNQSTKESGGFLIFIIISLSIGSLTSGYLLKRINIDVKPLSLWISFASVGFTLVGMILVFEVLKVPEPYDSDIGWKVVISVGLTTMGLGYGSYLVSALITVVALVGKEGQAAATGMNYLFRSIGQVLGVGVSLAVYDRSISKKLHSILNNVDHGDEIMEKLLHDTNYLKQGKLITEKLFYKLLEAYQEAMIDSFVPALALGVFSLLVSGFVAIKYGMSK